MADAMKLVPVGTANDIALFLRKWGTVQAKEMADALDASPPAREEATGEGAGEEAPIWLTSDQAYGWEAGYAAALRNRTSEPEAGAVAWRWRNKPDGVWNYQEAIQRIPKVEQQALYTHPAPATADKLQKAVFAWIKEDAPTGMQLMMKPGLVSKLVARLATLNEQPQ